jgi:predicted nucleotidyltransferase component of viral defense system
VIPRAYITAWRARAPWPDDAQVEQDLVLSRALVEMYDNPLVHEALAFRGGTALHKLFFEQPRRYSEDIDLVQKEAGPIGPVLDEIRTSFDPWLGEPRHSRGWGRVTLLYRFDTTTLPVRSLRLKIEINTREHFTVFGFIGRTFRVDNPWFSQETTITVYEFEELLATKLRALYQRKKGRDLYDLWLALESRQHELSDEQIVHCFLRYMDHGKTPVSRAQFERNIAGKLADSTFLEDIEPLLPTDAIYDPQVAAKVVLSRLVARIPGDPWKGSIAPR